MRKSLFIGLTAVLGLIGCSRNQEIDVPDANLSIFARTESPAETKTVVESGVHVFWEPGDEIAVFMGEQAAKFSTDITAASGTATFKGTFGEETWPEDLDLWAVYPFSEDAVFDGETITTTLPSEQVAREGSFGKDMNLAIAHSSGTTLQFYNVGGGIRFSVTEEGIKKVMFEGLSGEIISGKVKIGMDENGKPEVREVTGGSQFITLLPPTGQETFEPGAWYYIVAIPGSLEGGYKLRFYKDSDYARKVSEKKVEIKRSVFGNVEKADEGVDFEAQTTHFPETKEEWEESVSLTYLVGDRMDFLYQNYQEGKTFDSFKKDIESIDGVIFVSFAEDSSSVSILQRDSIWFNYFFNTQEEPVNASNNSASSTVYLQKARSAPQIPNTGIHNIESGTALIYAPFQWSFNKPLNEWENSMSDFFSDIKVLKKDDSTDNAGIIQLRESLSSHYDFMILDTHGGVGQSYKATRDFVSGMLGTNQTTILATSTIYYSDTYDKLIEQGLTPNDFATGKAGEGDSNVYVWITTDFLGNSRFDKSCVMITACKSAKKNDYSENDDNGSMLGAFINRGASIVTGAKVDMKSDALELIVSKCLEYMHNGLSFQKSFSYLTEKGGKLDSWLRIWYEYKRDNVSLWKNLSYKPWNIPDNYIIETNKEESKPIFFFNPFPTLGDIKPQGENVNFNWECRLNSFTINWFYDIVNNVGQSKDYPYNVIYDVYVGGTRLDDSLDPDNTDKTASCTLPPGDYSWHVVAVIMEGDTALTSYQSREASFTVLEEQSYAIPEAKDLGLSVKWASFNLGATKPEDYGDYFAWGETEPCYSSLDPLVWKPEKPYGYNWMHYKWAMGSETTLTKYCSDAEYGYNGFTDGKISLDPEDDAAQVNLGDKWRMPTDQEWEELTSNCSFVWTQQNGVSGFTVTSKKTGFTDKSIFLPAAGVWFWQNLNSAGSEGYYWSLTGYRDSQTCSYGFWFQSSGPGGCSLDRCYGFAIRPVYGDRKTIPSGDIEGTEEDPWN